VQKFAQEFCGEMKLRAPFVCRREHYSIFSGQRSVCHRFDLNGSQAGRQAGKRNFSKSPHVNIERNANKMMRKREKEKERIM